MRWAMIAVVLTIVALISGMQIGGDGVDMFGMYGLAVIVTRSGCLGLRHRVRFRSVRQAR
jgi:hypothetical protein